MDAVHLPAAPAAKVGASARSAARAESRSGLRVMVKPPGVLKDSVPYFSAGRGPPAAVRPGLSDVDHEPRCGACAQHCRPMRATGLGRCGFGSPTPAPGFAKRCKAQSLA